jgi:divalent metal cation (Fe/Co/Zn/Cd) transporter
VLSAGITSLIESVKKIFDPTEPSYTTTTLVVIVVAIVVKLILGQYVKRKGEQLKSDALIASGSDALFDAVITLATLISAGVMLLWGVSLDGILGSLISIVIIKAGIEMLPLPVNSLMRFSPWCPTCRWLSWWTITTASDRCPLTTRAIGSLTPSNSH